MSKKGAAAPVADQSLKTSSPSAGGGFRPAMALLLAVAGVGLAEAGAAALWPVEPSAWRLLGLSALIAAASLGALILFVMGASRFSDFFAHSLGLDLAVSGMTWAPWAIGGYFAGWIGFAGALAGQFVALLGFCVLHAMANPGCGPTIRATLNRLVGSWRNYAGLVVTSIAVPVFWFIRAAEIFVYPMLIWTLDFPRYNTREWVNVSRQKFRGLVGHDLVWCLYCDWMTGVYSLGAEMLRNVESFWCPIRFYSGPKCENCQIDFPDLKVWAPADSNMETVKEIMDDQYGGGKRSWFGHVERAGGAKKPSSDKTPKSAEPPKTIKNAAKPKSAESDSKPAAKPKAKKKKKNSK